MLYSNTEKHCQHEVLNQENVSSKNQVKIKTFPDRQNLKESVTVVLALEMFSDWNEHTLGTFI